MGIGPSQEMIPTFPLSMSIEGTADPPGSVGAPQGDGQGLEQENAPIAAPPRGCVVDVGALY